MPDIASLLIPISAEAPSGVDLKWEPDFTRIEEARKQEVDAPMGEWEREVKTADYKLVAKLATEALTAKTKDLRVAAWLAEAWIYQEGWSGLTAGLDLLSSLVTEFWDSVYPQVDDGDYELRAAPLDWFGSYFEPARGSSPLLAIGRLPIDNARHDFFAYKDERKVPTEAEVAKARDPSAAREARNELIAEKKRLREAIEKSISETPKAFYKTLSADLAGALERVQAIESLCLEKFPQSPPSFGSLRKALEDQANIVHNFLREKLKREPDAAVPGGGLSPNAPEALTEKPAPAADVDLSSVSGNIESAEQAVLHILAAARVLRQTDLGNPLSYALLRALRWGELRGFGELRSGEHPAPAIETRRALKAAAAAEDWRLVIELAEGALSGPSGRAWLDLHRYAAHACDKLGYSAAAKLIRSELKCLLGDFPDLPKILLNDDTGAANPETTAWLQSESLWS